MKSVYLKQQNESFELEVPLSASKSESNRALILDALTDFKSTIYNVSDARDTQTMLRLLQSKEKVADVIDAGTTMRFLTAYFSVKGMNKIMTGTPRMKERPIGILVDALRHIGVNINYLEQKGFPSIEIIDFKKQTNSEVSIKGNVSSQYISALLMIAPALEKGLKINLEGAIGSIPYINMTIQQMKEFGVEVKADWENQTLEVLPQKYVPTEYHVESDWSGASYWYSFVALSEDPNTKVKLLGLKENSLQGDSVIADLMIPFGVRSTFEKDGVLLEKIESQKSTSIDFNNCPDLAQTIAVVAVAKNIETEFSGIESLKIKETDRVLALQNELKKIGGELVEEVKNERYRISNSNFESFANKIEPIDTYDDHRMAMAFAPIAMLSDIEIENPEVVVKSYPEFWNHVSQILEIREII